MPNAAIFAKALFALHESGTLTLKACKPAVKIFIRQSSEEGMWTLNAHYHSVAALEIIASAGVRTRSQYHDFCRSKENGLTHEHMVPGEAVYKLITDHPNPTIQVFEELLLKTGFRAIITKAEDKRLLKSTMPSTYYDQSSSLYFSHLARYLEVSPEIKLVQMPLGGWFTK